MIKIINYNLTSYNKIVKHETLLDENKLEKLINNKNYISLKVKNSYDENKY